MASTSGNALPLAAKDVYALASLCLDTYRFAVFRAADAPVGMRRLPTWTELQAKARQFGRQVTRRPGPDEMPPPTLAQLQASLAAQITHDLERVGWPAPTALKPLLHRDATRNLGRLAGFAFTSDPGTVIALRGTVFSEEWMRNISYAVPAVRNPLQLLGLVLLSLRPGLQERALFRRAFDLEKGVGQTVGFAANLENVVAQTKLFLYEHVLDTPAAARPLWITGHSLGGACAVIMRLRLLRSSDARFREVLGPRMTTVTFGAPPLLAQSQALGAAEPPIYNVIRPDDVVPCLAADLLGLGWFSLIGVEVPFRRVALPRFPATPYHLGDHYVVRDHGTGAAVTITRATIDRQAVLRRALRKFRDDLIERKNGFRAVGTDHIMDEYAKDLECHALPDECRRWHANRREAE